MKCPCINEFFGLHSHASGYASYFSTTTKVKVELWQSFCILCSARAIKRAKGVIALPGVNLLAEYIIFAVMILVAASSTCNHNTRGNNKSLTKVGSEIGKIWKLSWYKSMAYIASSYFCRSK